MKPNKQIDKFFELFPGPYDIGDNLIWSENIPICWAINDKHTSILMDILNDSYRQWKRAKKKGK